MNNNKQIFGDTFPLNTIYMYLSLGSIDNENE